MAFFLRGIRRARWFRHPAIPWLPPGQLQADALLDLKTEGNSLSVYRIEDNRSNLERVVAALAASRDDPVNFDYALLEEAAVQELNILIETPPGDTPDEAVNRAWHRDLSQLTVDQLVELAKAIVAGVRDRVPQKRIMELLQRSLRDGLLDRGRVKATLLVKIEPTAERA